MAERDLVIRPGLHREYYLPIGGAESIDAGLSIAPELQQYVTLIDPAPKQGGRMVKVVIDFPDEVDVPPGIYGVGFNANELPSPSGQIATSVGVGFSFILRSYSEEPFLDITDVQLPPVPNGTKGTFTVRVISRTLVTIPAQEAEVTILDENGAPLVTGRARHGALESGEQADIIGTLDTESLAGGIYQSKARVVYGDKSASYNKSILRVGTLTIDLVDDYTKSFTFNQTNKFQFHLKSNWNKPLTRVAATVNLLGQSKRSPEQDIAQFGTSDTAEVYFDRTELPPGQQQGTMAVTYQELRANPALQDSAQTHTFTIPITVDIVLPPQPAKVKQEFHVTTTHIIISAVALIILINIILVVLLLRRPKAGAPAAPQAAPPAASPAPQNGSMPNQGQK